MEKTKLGFAMCGSYCTYEDVLPIFERLCEIYDVTPIMSETSASTDSRFGQAEDYKARMEAKAGKRVIDSIVAAEPIGPQKLLDVLVVAPCTGNTLAKLASGITDTCVTMACKAHLRNGRPLILAISTNDGLSGNAANIGALMNRKNVYLVPFYQDSPFKKPCSLVADFKQISETVEAALGGRQLQPLLLPAP